MCDECVFVVPLQQKLCYQGNHFSSVLLLNLNLNSLLVKRQIDNPSPAKWNIKSLLCSITT